MPAVMGNYYFVASQRYLGDVAEMKVAWRPNWLGRLLRRPERQEVYRGAVFLWFRYPDGARADPGMEQWLGGIWFSREIRRWKKPKAEPLPTATVVKS